MVRDKRSFNKCQIDKSDNFIKMVQKFDNVVTLTLYFIKC